MIRPVFRRQAQVYLCWYGSDAFRMKQELEGW